MDRTEAVNLGRQIPRSILKDCLLKASEGLDSLSLIDELISTPRLSHTFLESAKSWESLKQLIIMEAKLSPQSQGRLNKEIDYMHVAIDAAKKSNSTVKELRGLFTLHAKDLKDEVEMIILEELVDCACKND